MKKQHWQSARERMMQGLNFLSGAATRLWPIVYRCLRWLSPQASAQLMGQLAIWAPKGALHRRLLERLRVVFPDQSAHELLLLARQNWQNRGYVQGELPHLKQLLDAPQHVRWLDRWGLPEASESSTPSVYVVLPMVNTWLSLCLCTYIHSKLVLISNLRGGQQNARAFYEPLFQRGEARIVKQPAAHLALEDGYSPLCCFDVDLPFGLEVPFFETRTKVDPMPALLSWRSGCPIRIPVIARLGPACFALTAIKTLETLPRTDIQQFEWVQDTCARLTAYFGEQIQRQPGA